MHTLQCIRTRRSVIPTFAQAPLKSRRATLCCLQKHAAIDGVFIRSLRGLRDNWNLSQIGRIHTMGSIVPAGPVRYPDSRARHARLPVPFPARRAVAARACFT